MEIKNIGVHHMDGVYTLSQVNSSHRQRWPDFPSELRPDLYVGYNIAIWLDGTWTQCRFIGEETAAQKGHNFDTVSIALQGSFTRGKDSPTPAQIKTLIWMMRIFTSVRLNDLKPVLDAGFFVARDTKINIDKSHIYPHRVLQLNHTECYGSGLSDRWAANLLLESPTPDPVMPSVPAFVPVAPASSPGPDETAWIRLLQSFQELLKLWERIFGRPALGSARAKCSTTDVRG
jgi:hypothetical protein